MTYHSSDVGPDWLRLPAWILVGLALSKLMIVVLEWLI